MAKNITFTSKRNMIKTFKPFFIILTLCGLNYKVFKVKKFFRYIYFFYCASLIGIALSTTLLCCSNTWSQLWAVMEYVLSAIILIIYDTKLGDFCKNLQNVDCSLRIKSDIYDRTIKKIFFLVVGIWLFRIAFTTIYCITYVCFSSITLYLISLISPFVLDINRVWRFILVDMIRSRLRILRLRVEEMPGCNFYLHVKENKMFKEDKVSFLRNVFREIADTADLMMPEIKASMFASVICAVPKLINNVYHLLLVIEGHEPLVSIGFLILHSIQVCFFLFSPSVGIELQVREVEKIRLCLFHQYMETTDVKTKEEIQVFLQYTELRQFRSKIWRAIPLDITLPLEIISFCGSSIVVILNFSHLFD